MMTALSKYTTSLLLPSRSLCLNRPTISSTGTFVNIPRGEIETRKQFYFTTNPLRPFRQLSTVTNETPKATETTTVGKRSKVTFAAPRSTRIVVAITGATGTLFAIRLLEVFRDLGIETHLIISKWAVATMKYETSMAESELRGLATASYGIRDVSAPISSGSFLHDGMIIVPCSMKTMAAVRTGFCEDLIARAADVTLKEQRRLMLVVRETPLSDIHLENMLSLRRAGATIFPPVPAFYTRPKSIEELVDQSVGRMLDAFGIHTNNFERWTGFAQGKASAAKT